MIVLCFVPALTSSSDSPAPGTLPDCGLGVNLTVSSGTTPTFDWNPECRVGFLSVQETGDTDLWSIFAVNMTNAIAPGVTYGLVPEGAVQDGPLEPLSPGTTYFMGIVVFEPEGQDENFEIVATAMFTP